MACDPFDHWSREIVRVPRGLAQCGLTGHWNSIERSNVKMSKNQSVATAQESVSEEAAPAKERRQKPRRQPRYNVILWNDDDHSFEYVIEMMQDLFGFAPEQGFGVADTVHSAGRCVCLTTTMEHAELKRDQIHAYGRDGLIDRCIGSMSATIEPIE
jgi:ATP-dependent Clp protease adaptor protein ClpS